jgi:uncharacterized protein YjbI with pentapeptide repeats
MRLFIVFGIVLGMGALALALWLWWWLPKWQVNRLIIQISDPKARADVEDNFRKTIGQLLGGVAVLLGAGLAYFQFSQQQNAAQQQFLRQQQDAHDLLISNQVAKGFEQLGSKTLILRLGGIYALEGALNTSEQYHKPVLEALSSFVRDNTRSETRQEPPTTDIQAVLTVIGRRAEVGQGDPDLANAHIPKANLSGAKLRRADLTGADLTGADLTGAHLTGAHLTGANLTGADFSGSESDADWAGGPADMRYADLTRANLSHANLTGANLTSANLSNADLRDAIVSQEQLDSACGTKVTLNGPHLQPP